MKKTLGLFVAGLFSFFFASCDFLFPQTAEVGIENVMDGLSYSYGDTLDDFSYSNVSIDLKDTYLTNSDITTEKVSIDAGADEYRIFTLTWYGFKTIDLTLKGKANNKSTYTDNLTGDSTSIDTTTNEFTLGEISNIKNGEIIKVRVIAEFTNSGVPGTIDFSMKTIDRIE